MEIESKERKPMLGPAAGKKYMPIIINEEKSKMIETSCGLTRFFRPKWLQSFATTRSYMVVYGLLGTVQAMSFVYFTVTLTHIERRFKIPSKTTGMMLSGNEVSQILLSLLLTYIGGQKNRPVWVAWGVACSAASCFIIILPHFLYGSGEDALTLTKEYLDSSKLHNLTDSENLALCSNSTTSDADCKHPTTNDFSAVPTVTIFISQFVLGIGTTLYFSLGQTYIDDNTKKTNTPMLLAITLALRTIGPVFGFLIGYVCLKLYVDPSLTPLISNKDPRWIGAWWLGWIFLGAAQFLLAIVLAMFPRKMPQHTSGQLENNLTAVANYNFSIQGKDEKVIDKDSLQKGKTEKNEEKNQKVGDGEKAQVKTQESPPEPSFEDFLKALKRLLTNKLLIVNCWSGIFYILGSSGFITYMVKYLEIQFQKSAADSSIVTGPTAIIAMCFGFLSSGIVISKYRPGPRKLLLWNVIVGISFIIGQFIMMTLSCEEQPLQGYDSSLNRVDLTNVCNADCGCANLKYNPVCHRESDRSFYSACHAGCRSSHRNIDASLMYGDCQCIDSNKPWQNETSQAFVEKSITQVLQSGPCPATCGYNFILFLIVSSVMHFLGCSGKIGNILVNYRGVNPEDKTFAQGLSLLMISLFAFIPGPILYGYIIDTTCIIWEESCGRRGNCWLYNKDDFRHMINSTAIVLTSIGVILDAWVCYLGRDLDLYGETDENEDKPPK